MTPFRSRKNKLRENRKVSILFGITCTFDVRCPALLAFRKKDGYCSKKYRAVYEAQEISSLNVRKQKNDEHVKQKRGVQKRSKVSVNIWIGSLICCKCYRFCVTTFLLHVYSLRKLLLKFQWIF